MNRAEIQGWIDDNASVHEALRYLVWRVESSKRESTERGVVVMKLRHAMDWLEHDSRTLQALAVSQPLRVVTDEKPSD